MLKILLTVLLAINFAFSLNYTPNKKIGFFSSKLWFNYQENLNSEIELFSYKPTYILWYTQCGQSFPTDIVNYNKSLNIYTIISHDLRSDNFKNNNNILKEIVKGEWDCYFEEFAKNAKESNINVYYRFGYEMNGKWFEWGKKPKLFVDAWVHVWKIFKEEGASNIKWIFSPNVIKKNQTFKSGILRYYPGDEFVDIVSLDGYNFGDNHDEYSSWKSFIEIYKSSIIGLEKLNKPMWITEIGCPSDKRRPEWLKEFFRFFDSSKFEVFIWFNDNKDKEPNFRIDADNESKNLFQEMIKKY